METWYNHSLGLNAGLFLGFGVFAALILLIVVVLKGYSLWYAARRGEKWWFIILLIVNTMGILELIYLIFVVKKWHKSTGSVNGEPTPTTPSAPKI